MAVRTNGDLNYLLGDHLNSSSITTDSSGQYLAELRYYPWGGVRYTSGNTPTSYRFTGQRLEASLGLYFYGARWYDSLTGRFIQADTIVPGGVQGLDRYAYSYGNPVKYIDPSGHIPCDGKYSDGIYCDSECVDFSDSDLIDAITYEFGIDVGIVEKIPPNRLKEVYDKLTELRNSLTNISENINSVSNNIPGTSQDWYIAAKVFDGIAWLSDVYASGVVTFSGIAGAGIPAIFVPVGVPEVPVVTGGSAMLIAELYIQPVLSFGNAFAVLGTAATVVADSKDSTRVLDNGTINSITLTTLGLFAREAYLSFIIQSLTLTNDFGWVSFPIP